MTSSSTPIKLNTCRSIWAFRLEINDDENAGLQEALDQSIIYIWHGGDIDWTGSRFCNFEAVLEEWRKEKDPKVDKIDRNVREPVRFKCCLEKGDYVIVRANSRQFRAFGEIIEKYEFDPTAGGPHHKRRVKWIWPDSAGGSAVKNLAGFYSRGLGPQKGIRKLRGKICWHKLEALLACPDRA